MKVVHRLYLTTVPAVLGVFAVAALAYWGQYARTVPEVLLVVAAIASISTMAFAWINVRYIAQRVERLASVDAASTATVSIRALSNDLSSARTGNPDELDAIEHVVGRLSSAVTLAASDRAASERRYEERAHDYARMLALVADSATQRLDEIRLPLHILLENHFGDLNENQEEMLGAARAAAEATDADLVALREIAALDLGAKPVRRDRIFPADLLQALLPTLQASAQKVNAVLRADIHPLIPPIWADQAQLQDSLNTLLRSAILSAESGALLQLELAHETSGVLIRLSGAPVPPPSIHGALAMRVVQLNGGSTSFISEVLTITLS
ncbi:MAG: hypothetical protein ABJB66_10285 [Gemmatimonadaceae bacterium]